MSGLNTTSGLRLLAGVALLAVLCWWAFAPGLGGEFVFLDDEHYVEGNEQVHRGLTWATAAWSFTTFSVGNWHPLTWLSYLLDWELFGGDPGAFHRTSLAWHIATVGLLYLVFARLSRDVWSSLLAVALFAVHPLRVESVVWISERKDVLSGFFLALTLWFYVRFCDRPSPRRFAAVTAAYACGLMSKPVLVTLPALLLLVDVWPLGRFDTPEQASRWRRGFELVKEKLPLMAMAIASAVVTVVAQQQALASFDIMPIGARVANAAVAVADYLRTTIWPVGLAPFYPFEEPEPGAVAVAAFVVLGLSALAFIPRIRRVEWSVGWTWFLIALVPMIGLVQVGGQARADRYTYVPAVGLSLALVGLLGRLEGRIRLRALAIGACAVVALAGASRGQSSHWLSSEALLVRIVTVTDDNWLAEATLASLLAQRGDREGAIVHYLRALELRPDQRAVRSDLAATLSAAGRPEEALRHYRELFQSGPPEPGLRLGFAAALDDAGLAREAFLQLLLGADEAEPPPAVWAGLSMLSKRLGRDQVSALAGELERRAPDVRFARALREGLESDPPVAMGGLDADGRRGLELVIEGLQAPATTE